jgi:hypothetical protein
VATAEKLLPMADRSRPVGFNDSEHSKAISSWISGPVKNLVGDNRDI